MMLVSAQKEKVNELFGQPIHLLQVGRDWFPGGPYTLTGRGSIPLRSTITFDNTVFIGGLQ